MGPYSQDELAEARATIEAIRTAHGPLKPEDVESLQRNHPHILELLKDQRRTIGNMNRMLSGNLYSESTRFIFELIQNADDNRYANAKQAHELPRISLTLNPDGFVLDCNEDGFTKEHVAAICKVSASTKGAEKARGYIGEKGIGFKSVFRVFKRAQIQSGPFAFSFSYNPHGGEDAGLDLITPILEEHAEIPANVKTRISLSLPYGSNFEDMRKHLLEVPDTMLLFLHRIRQLEIHINAPDQKSSSVIYTHRRQSSNVAFIKQESVNDGSTKRFTTKYFLERISAVDLPAHETRKGIHTAEILLAFPVEANDSPILKPQHAYAFLPLQESGFKFLIQSDFITSANRQELDVDCERNIALMRQAAKAFRNAVLGFASDDGPEALQYNWPGFIPSEDAAKASFWERLRAEILNLLQDQSVVRAWDGRLCLPKGLHHLPRHMQDKYKNALLPDSPTPTYLSPKYGLSEVLQLQSLGVLPFSPQLFLARLATELQDSQCNMRVLSFEHSWRKSLANCLRRLWDDEPSLRPEMRKLPLVHLQGGKLVSVEELQCYWPKIRGTDVPNELDIPLVSQKAIDESTIYKGLLKSLGVAECSVDLVVAKIVDVYTDVIPILEHASVVHHQHFLFKFAPDRTKIVIPIMVHHNEIFEWEESVPEKREHHVYFSELSDKLCPGKLLKTGLQIHRKAEVHFLYEEYLTIIPGAEMNEQNCTWMSWLETRCGVRPAVQLLTPSRANLSKEFRHLLCHDQTHALQLMQAQWPVYQSRLEKLMSLLSKVELQTEGKDGDKALLKDLYARHSGNQHDIEKVGADGSLFLDPPAGSNRFDQSWRFLTHLGVRFELDLNFYLRVLESICPEYKSVSGSEDESTSSAGNESASGSEDESASSAGNESASGSEDDPASGSEDDPASGLEDDPASGLEDDPASGLEDDPASGLEDDPASGLEDDPASGLEDDPASGLEDEPALTFEHVLNIYRVLAGQAGSDSEARTEIKQFALNNFCAYIPGGVGDGTNAAWAYAADCCWGGRSFLTVVSRLSAIPQYKSDGAIKTLFKDVWEVPNATFSTYIDELSEMKTHGIHDPDKVAKLYRELYKLRTPSTESDISKDLKSKHLFYHPTQEIWISPEKCAWVESKIRLDGYHGVSDLYDDVDGLKEFLCNIIGIKEPSVRMYVKTLQQAVEDVRPFSELKEHMYQISVLRPERSDLKKLRTASIFEVRAANGTKSMVSTEHDFCILDREDYTTLFRNKVSSLCLSLKEIQQCRKFLHALGLGQRFCSRAAIRRTQVADDLPSPDLTVRLRGLTKHMLRCAAFYNESADGAQLQKLAIKLQNMHAHVSDDITKYVEIRQGGHFFKSDERQANFHFSDDDSGLKLYIPEDDEERECCYHHDLPMGLMGILGIDDESAVAPIQSILTSRYPRVIAEKLAGAGVPALTESLKLLVKPVPQSANIPIPSMEVRNEPEIDLADTLNGLHISSSQSRQASRGRSVSPSTQASAISFTTNFARRSSSQSRGPALISAPRTPSPNRRDEFAQILERIIKTAKRAPRTTIPSSPAFSEVFARGDPQRDSHVGVAGEVYLLNYLRRRHNLDRFGIRHWRSSIRTLAAAHEWYRDIGRSSRAEDADFVYEDHPGTLTQLLKDEGALPVNANLAPVVKYYLEVKTTTSGCNEKFYMSQNQVNRMEDMTMLPNVRASRLYVIARVFNIDGPNIGVKFYVDPHRLRDIIRPFHHEIDAEDDVLKFSAEKWVIRVEG